MHLAGSLAGRNVVLIVLESTAARHLGLYGAHRRSDATSHQPRARRHRVQSRVLPCTPKVSRAVRDAVLEVSRLRCAARGVPRRPLRVTRPHFEECRLPDVAVSFRTVHVSRHGGRHPGSRLRSAGRCRGDWWPGRLELRRRRSVDGRADARLDRFAGRGAIASSSPTSRSPVIILTRQRARAVRRRRGLSRYLNALHEGDAALGHSFEVCASGGWKTTRCSSCSAITAKRLASTPGISRTRCSSTTRTCACRTSSPRPASIAGQIRVTRSPASSTPRRPCSMLLGLAAIQRAHQGTSLLAPGARMALFLHRLLAGMARPGGRVLEISARAGYRPVAAVRRVRDPDETRIAPKISDSLVRAYRDRVQHWAAAQRDSVRHSH